MARPRIRRLHSDEIYEGGLAKISLEYLRQWSTGRIIESLAPGSSISLKVADDGLVKDGNTRIKILEERGVDVNSLPREVVP